MARNCEASALYGRQSEHTARSNIGRLTTKIVATNLLLCMGLKLWRVNLNWNQVCIRVEFSAQAHQLVEVIDKVHFIICRDIRTVSI